MVAIFILYMSLAPTSKVRQDLRCEKTSDDDSRDEESLMICIVILTQCTSVKDTETDGLAIS